jgi:hypothetical protein
MYGVGESGVVRVAGLNCRLVGRVVCRMRMSTPMRLLRAPYASYVLSITLVIRE